MSSPVRSTRYGIEHSGTAYRVDVDFMSTDKAIFSKQVSDKRMKNVRKDVAILFSKLVEDKSITKQTQKSVEFQIFGTKDENYISITLPKGKGKKKIVLSKELKANIDRIKDDILFDPGEIALKTVQKETIHRPVGNIVITMRSYKDDTAQQLRKLQSEDDKAAEPETAPKRSLVKTIAIRELDKEVQLRLTNRLESQANFATKELKDVDDQALALSKAAKEVKDRKSINTAKSVRKLSRGATSSAQKVQKSNRLKDKARHMDQVNEDSEQIFSTLEKAFGPSDPAVKDALNKAKATAEANTLRRNQAMDEIDDMLSGI